MWGSEKRLEDYLHARLQRALVELAGIDPDAFLSENTDVLVAGLLERHMPTEIVVDWNEPSRTPVTEVVTQERDRIVPGRVYRVPASKLVVSFPISGSAELLDYQASTFSISEASGKVSAGRVVVEIIERRLDAEMVRSHIERVQQDIDKRAEWANIDLRRFRSTADRSLRNAHESRKARLLNDRAVEEALGIPVHRSSAPRPPVPARRKQVALQERRTQAAFVPEPVLD
ncbi:hypothetical protein GTA28_28310, partial [Rhodococcus hoagii]|nr:hypothetical protein [Prescottella equi]